MSALCYDHINAHPNCLKWTSFNIGHDQQNTKTPKHQIFKFSVVQIENQTSIFLSPQFFWQIYSFSSSTSHWFRHPNFVFINFLIAISLFLLHQNVGNYHQFASSLSYFYDWTQFFLSCGNNNMSRASTLCVLALYLVACDVWQPFWFHLSNKQDFCWS